MSEFTPFVILAAERTGSNLLAGLLDSHPDMIAAGELFNPLVRKSGDLPWRLARKSEVAALAALRESDPVAFLERLAEQAGGAGLGFFGFKLLYFHADKCEPARRHLAGNAQVRVLHLTRQNLLRRYVSLLRAKATGEWQRRADEGGPQQQPKVAVSLPEFLKDAARIRAWEQDYRAAFAGHPVLELTYEELSEDPAGVGRRAVEFLGGDPEAPLDVRTRKTGVDPLRDAVSNYDELSEQLAAFAGFCDD